MATSPSYVRLVERLNRGIVADVEGGSGWSIAGLDVKEMPDPKRELAAHTFVQYALRVGKLEAAEASEYEDVQTANSVIAEAAAFDPDAGESLNEAAVQAAVKEAMRLLTEGKPDAEAEAEAAALEAAAADEAAQAKAAADAEKAAKAEAAKAAREAKPS